MVLNAKVKNSIILKVPELILNAGIKYYWRYRNKTPKADNSWSDSQSFVTVTTDVSDNNGDGIPDDQAAPSGLDLNQDGILDEAQYDSLRCIKTTMSDYVVALGKTEGVVDIEMLESIDNRTITDNQGRPDSMPSGMIGFRVVVDVVGSTVDVDIYFNQPIPEDALWYKYDSVNGWQDYSANTVISSDRTKITVTLTDGGLGDTDGYANGVIVDPSGFALMDSDSGVSWDAVEEAVEAQSCFIGGVTTKDASGAGWFWMLVPIMGLWVVYRQKERLVD